MQSQTSEVEVALPAPLRQACAADVAAMTAVHMAGFPGFFLTFLGPQFLTVLYDRMIALPEAIAFVAAAPADQVVGFVVGTTSQRSLYRALLTDHWLAFGWAALGPVLRRPQIALRLLRALRRPTEAEQSVADCLLASIAVLPDQQGQHVGAALVRAFLQEAAARGAQAVSLTTDRVGNDTVNRFYVHMGFSLVRSFVTAEGRQMNEYVITLPPVQH